MCTKSNKIKMPHQVHSLHDLPRLQKRTRTTIKNSVIVREQVWQDRFGHEWEQTRSGHFRRTKSRHPPQGLALLSEVVDPSPHAVLLTNSDLDEATSACIAVGALTLLLVLFFWLGYNWALLRLTQTPRRSSKRLASDTGVREALLQHVVTASA